MKRPTCEAGLDLSPTKSNWCQAPATKILRKGEYSSVYLCADCLAIWKREPKRVTLIWRNEEQRKMDPHSMTAMKPDKT